MFSPLNPLLLSVLLALTFSGPGTAHGEGGDPPKKASASGSSSKKKKNAPPKWKSPEEAYSAGLLAVENGQDAEAAEALEFATSVEKPYPNGFYLLARAYGHLGRYTEARAAVATFHKLDPNSPQAAAADKLLHDFDTAEATRFVLKATPVGATFALDSPGGLKVVAPAEMHVLPGAHRLYVTSRGYDASEVEATAVLGEAVAVAATLVPTGCDLMAEVAVPATSATLAVDDESPESAPGPVRVRPGKHRVLVAPAGGAPIASTIECVSIEPLQVSVVAPAPTEGRIAIAVPPGGKLTVDGHDRAVTDGHALIELPPGEHLVDVEAEGKIPWHTATMVHAGEVADLTPVLEAGGGATGIEVTPVPATASITIDGKAARAGEMVRITSGKRVVTVHAAGFFAETRTIDVLTGERSHVEVRLERRGRFLLYLGLAAIPLGLAAEGLALVGHFDAANELAGSPAYERWHTLELTGHIVAGAAAATMVGAITGYLLQQRSPDETRTRVGAAIDGHGASLVLSRSF